MVIEITRKMGGVGCFLVLTGLVACSVRTAKAPPAETAIAARGPHEGQDDSEDEANAGRSLAGRHATPARHSWLGKCLAEPEAATASAEATGTASAEATTTGSAGHFERTDDLSGVCHP